MGKADGCTVSLVEKLEVSLAVSAQESAQKRLDTQTWFEQGLRGRTRQKVKVQSF